MGKNSPTPKKSAIADEKSSSAPAAKKPSAKAEPKKKSLVSKAAKAVAAVAVGVGSAMAVKRKKTESAKRPASPRSPKPRATTSVGVPRPTQEDISLRAYFISERRRNAGLPADPHQDWLDAERELASGDGFPST